MKTRLTEKIVKNLRVPDSGNKITYDSDIPGFGARITYKEVVSFVLNYHVAGRERRFTIGRHPAWSVAAAREEAKRLRRMADGGEDPLELRKLEREAPTVKDLWEEYERRHVPSFVARSQSDIRSMWNNYIIPKLGSVKLKHLTSDQVDKLHDAISETKPVRANRVIESLRGALNRGIRWGKTDSNPAIAFEKNEVEARETYLTPEKLSHVVECLNRMPNKQAADVVRLLILTGARLGEVLKAEWREFDLEQGIWTKPPTHTKQKRIHRVPISQEAIELLKRMELSDAGKHLFPSTTGQPIPDIKKPWEWLQKEADIPDVRIHDLRHTYASLLISSGEGLAVIGKLLGHSQHQTTMRYAHLMDDPLRKATNKIGRLANNGRRG